MDWIKVSIFTKRTGIDAVLGILLDFGIDSTQVYDEGEFSEFLAENRGAWDYVDENLCEEMAKETHIDFYVKSDEITILDSIKAALLKLKSSDANGIYGRLELVSESLQDDDWLNRWKDHFHTFTIADKLVIKPYWEKTAVFDKKIFEINPGLSFGTGTHHTTKMCLEDIVNVVKNNDTVLDLGAGSGILAIVSLLFGAGKATAIDIDENSLKTISENLERNKISKDKCDIYIGNVLENDELRSRILENRYDVVIANIVADVVIALLPFIKKAIARNGIFIASGIIEGRIAEVRQKIISCGFDIISEKRSADWAEFLCRLQ